jgi:hypothetical protein
MIGAVNDEIKRLSIVSIMQDLCEISKFPQRNFSPALTSVLTHFPSATRAGQRVSCQGELEKNGAENRAIFQLATGYFQNSH